jgi:hypothetical protein
MKKIDAIPDPTYKPAYKLKESKPVPDPVYKPTYKIKEQKEIPDPVYKPTKLKTLTPRPLGKSLVQSFMGIFTPAVEKPKPLVSHVDASYAEVFLPSVGGRVRPLPESAPPKAQKSVPIIIKPTPKPIEVKKIDVEEVVSEPAVGSREWRKKQFKASNFI